MLECASVLLSSWGTAKYENGFQDYLKGTMHQRQPLKVKVSRSLIAVGLLGFGGPLYLWHSR